MSLLCSDVQMLSVFYSAIEVGYDPVSYVTTETAGFVDLAIRVFSHPGGSPQPFSLAINTEDGTASRSEIKALQLLSYFTFLLIHRGCW